MSDFPEITTKQIVARLRMIVAEPDSLCKTDLHYIEDAADELESKCDEVQRLTAERDEARRDAERWEDDALRLMTERNTAEKERDEARRAYCIAAWRLLPDEQATTITPARISEQRGWNWRLWAPFTEADK